MAPLLFTTLLGTYRAWVPLALYIAITAVLTVTGLWLGRDPATAAEEEPDRGPADHAAPATACAKR